MSTATMENEKKSQPNNQSQRFTEHDQKSLADYFERQVKSELKDELQKNSWEQWIKPLRVISFKDNVLTLLYSDCEKCSKNNSIDCSRCPLWVKKHYKRRIQEKVGAGIEIKFTNEVE